MKIRKTLTVDLIMSFGPTCWTYEQIEQQFGSRKQCTVFDVLDCKAVKLIDKFWLLLRSDFLSDKHKRLFACDCAARALRRESKAGRKPDPRSYAAVRIARRFAVGKVTKSELVAAYVAAYVAADVAAYAAASAAYAAASAAYAAASAASAAYVAAYVAASAAYAAAYDEQNWQLNRLKFYLKKEHEKK